VKLKLTCKEVTHLLLSAQDRKLPLVERLRIRLHMRICEPCPRFERQVQLMQRASARWRQYSGE